MMAARGEDGPRADAALDAALALYQAPLDADAFAARALARFGAPVAAIESLDARRRRAGPALALAACMMVGLLAGFGMGRAAPTDAADQTLTAAFGNILYTDEASEG